MKTISSLIVFLSVLCVSAQIEKVETFTTGTKITFYPDSCEEGLPEAEGKISFCDNAGNLGVVERSYGLNARGIIETVPNYYNNDEVFMTRGGFSIRREDGTWLNIPQLALSRRTLTSASTQPRAALVDSDGNLFYTNGNYNGVHLINLNTLDFEDDELSSDFVYAQQFAHDEQSKITYLLVGNSSRNRTELYKYENGSYSLVGVVPDMPRITSSSNNTFFENGKIYLGGYSGLFVIDPLNISASKNLITDYDFLDIKAGPDGRIWMASRETSSVGGIYVFDPNTEALTKYSRSFGVYDSLPFSAIAVEADGTVWASSQAYLGIIKLTFTNDEPVWEHIPRSFFESEGLPFNYRPDNIAVQNGKVYFGTVDGSSSTNSKYEGLIYENGRWSGINDDEPGNISNSLGYRFQDAYPAEDGVWWSNSYDDILTFVSDDDEFSAKYNLRMSDITVDTDDLPVVISSGLVKYNNPITYELPSENNENFVGVTRFKDQIWGYNRSNGVIVAYKDDRMVARYDLDQNYSGNYHFNADTEGNAWFASYDSSSNTFIAKEFNTVTLQTIEHTFSTESLGSQQEIITMPNGVMAFVWSRAILVFDGNTFVRLDSDLNAELNAIKNAQADADGNLHILRNDTARIIKVTSIFDNPEASVITIEGNSSIVPYIGQYRPDHLVIDHKGNYWTHASGNWIKIHLTEPIEAFYNEGETFGLIGRVYNDINENDAYDPGEEYANQHVALTTGNSQIHTYTGNGGEFYFSYRGENLLHRVTLLKSDPYILIKRVQAETMVTDLTQNTNLGDFELEPLFINGLVVKSSAKLGMYGFDRNGFENTFTAAVGSLANAKTYTDLDIQFLFENPNGSDNTLPNIVGAKMFKVSPQGASPIIKDITIEPKNHSWRLKIPPSSYTVEEINITPQINTMAERTTVSFAVDELKPFEAVIMQIETDLFDPVQNGTVIKYGVSKIGGPNINNNNDGGGSDSFDLIPRDPNDDNVGGPEDMGPYISPDDIYSDPPYIDPKDVYSDPPYESPILSSYDPNDKLVTPGIPTLINETDINQKWLQYMIRFENEGNFSAKDVYVVDEIDENFDINSITVLESSHPMQLEQITAEGKTIIKFAFEEIYLDYTSNDPEASQGYVKFLIKAKDDIAENTIVENTASIYFDQNPAIVTNTTQNKFVELNLSTETTEVTSAEISYFPNPVREGITVKFPKTGSYSIQVYDLSGKMVMSRQSQHRDRESLVLSHFANGIYLLKVANETFSQTVKIIKQ